jgi:tetratricopeptide (TPR) repeat protein
MENIGHFTLVIISMLLGGTITLWALWKTIKHSEDPARVAFKWLVTGVVFLLLGGVAARTQGPMAVSLPVVASIFGVFLGILWAPHIGAMIAKPFTSIYDGGGGAVEVRPFYSIARAKQKRGNYPEAIAAIQEQLQRFPEDYEGWMFLAEIYARDLKNNEEAQNCVREILSHSDHAPKNIAFTLNCSADWHLELASDRDAASQALERIVLMFPETEFSHSAEQRIAHLTSSKMLSEQRERPRLALTRHDEYIGLQGKVADPRPIEEDHGSRAARLVAQLEVHPGDVEAREQLASIYAEEYHRLDMAKNEVEQLISSTGAGAKEVARWLNMLADFQARGGDRAAAEESLRRIIQSHPESAAAAKAEMRIAYLETEIRANSKSQALKLGSYEENIGLKGQTPKIPVD